MQRIVGYIDITWQDRAFTTAAAATTSHQCETAVGGSHGCAYGFPKVENQDVDVQIMGNKASDF